jgi:hypothetical protein
MISRREIDRWRGVGGGIALSAGGGPGAMLMVVHRTNNSAPAFCAGPGFIHFQGARSGPDRRWRPPWSTSGGSVVARVISISGTKPVELLGAG